MTVVTVGPLSIHVNENRLVRAGVEVQLTAKEFKMLMLLAQNVGSPVTKTELSRYALGRSHMPFERVVNVHISNLKKKIGPLDDGRSMIKTVVLVGYQLQI
jgi:two-component system OmpR family response regulator